MHICVTETQSFILLDYIRIQMKNFKSHSCYYRNPNTSSRPSTRQRKFGTVTSPSTTASVSTKSTETNANSGNIQTKTITSQQSTTTPTTTASEPSVISTTGSLITVRFIL